MMDITFRPTHSAIDDVWHTALVKEIEAEPMLYGASWNFAMSNGGPLTKNILKRIERDVEAHAFSHMKMGYHPVIDTKSVMLMPDWCPCIPGWHCDGVIRQDQSSQPDMGCIDEPIIHYTCWIGDNEDLPATEFLDEDVTLVVGENKVWASVDEGVNELDGLQGHDLRIHRPRSGAITKFSRSQLHRGVHSEARGWRYFFRLSFYHMPALDQMRNQVQVYPRADGGGW